MHPSLKAKLTSIEIQKKKTRKKGIILLLLFGSEVSIYFIMYYTQSLSFFIPFIRELLLYMTFFSFMFVIAGIFLILDPLNAENKAFCEIVEAIELLKSSIENPTLRQHAYQNILNASKHLKSLKRGEGSWYRKIRSTERRFINNLRNRAAPAILEGELHNIDLLGAALIFTTLNIEQIKRINKAMEEKFEEKAVLERTIMSRINVFISSKPGILLFSISFGYLLIILFSLVFTRAINEEFLTFIKTNPAVILIGGATISGATMTFLSRE